MTATKRSVLLLGESNVGKTHYGAQFLKRLIVGRSSLKMNGQATNLGPFEDAMDNLADGRATGHTPSEVYNESVWPVIDGVGATADLVWPDYGGEQIKTLIADHRIATAWRERIIDATDWLLLVRLHTLQRDADIFSRPLAELGKPVVESLNLRLSDQARLIELLQMLLHVTAIDRNVSLRRPTLTVLLSCWDEVEAGSLPPAALRTELPLLCDFIESVWDAPMALGLSALEKPLGREESDQDYATRGPEAFGYVVRPDGHLDRDITWPITRLLTSA